MVRDTAVHLKNRLCGTPFPKYFSMCLSVCNVSPINGSGCCWTKCCVNTAGKNSLCSVMPPVLYPLWSNFLLGTFSISVSPPVDTGQLHRVETSDCSSQVTTDRCTCLSNFRLLSCSVPLLQPTRVQETTEMRTQRENGHWIKCSML